MKIHKNKKINIGALEILGYNFQSTVNLKLKF